jgi:hypothetical protein
MHRTQYDTGSPASPSAHEKAVAIERGRGGTSIGVYRDGQDRDYVGAFNVVNRGARKGPAV